MAGTDRAAAANASWKAARGCLALNPSRTPWNESKVTTRVIGCRSHYWNDLTMVMLAAVKNRWFGLGDYATEAGAVTGQVRRW